MKLTMTYFDHPLHISLSPSAAKMLEQRSTPLFVDARLYFGCLAKKGLAFDEEFAAEPSLMINSKLYLRYQSLISDGCKIDGSESHYRPTPKQMGSLHWLDLDYQNGEWVGDFGLESKLDAQEDYKEELQVDFTW